VIILADNMKPENELEQGGFEMPDENDDYGMSDDDIVFVLTALEALKQDLAEMLEDETTRPNAQWHIDIANTTQKKLDNRELEYSYDEMRVMYIAALQMRDFMNKILDGKSVSDYDREMAKSTLRSANGMLRTLRKTFTANGMDVDDLV
jgi:hypothetical protein